MSTWGTVARILWAIRSTVAAAVVALADGRISDAERERIARRLAEDIARAVVQAVRP